MTSDEELLHQAVAVAHAARDHGNHPFGALLVTADGEVALRAENTVVTERDATGHAETNLVRLASPSFSRAELSQMSLYSSAEPCAMCAGAVYWSGIGRVVFALAETELLGLTGDDPENPTLSLPCREVFAAGQRPITVVGPYDLSAAVAVHQDFWNH